MSFLGSAVLVKLVALLIGSGGLAGMVAYVLHSQKKAGQKQAEAEIVQTEITNAKAAGIVIAEHRTVDDAAGKLSNGGF